MYFDLKQTFNATGVLIIIKLPYRHILAIQVTQEHLKMKSTSRVTHKVKESKIVQFAISLGNM